MIYKKFIAIILTLTIIITVFIENSFSTIAPSISLVALGDSIATGYGLKDKSDSYVNKLSKFLDASTTNLSQNGQVSSTLLLNLKTSKDYSTAVKNADIVTISIGGNNILLPLVASWIEAFKADSSADFSAIQSKMLSSLQSNPTETYNKLKTAYTLAVPLINQGIETFDKDFPKIIETIKEYNPSAKIVVSTVFNAYNNFKFENVDLRSEISSKLTSLNNVIAQSLTTQPDSFIIADVYYAFNNDNSENLVNSNIKELYFDPHPTKKGHNKIFMVHKDILETSFYFNDIAGHWAEHPIMVLASRGITSGIGNKKFAPDSNITRAQFIKLLANLSSENLSKYTTSNFSDVKSSDWFGPAVIWASDNKIVNGIGINKFDPYSNITREQMFVIFYNYKQSLNSNISSISLLNAYTDNHLISPWAKNAINYLHNEGIISGKKDNILAPKELATRAEAAKLLLSY